MRSALKPHLPLLWLLGLLTLLRLCIAPTFGLGVDEAHYVLYGRYLDMSYFDHPPLVGWLHAAFAALFGEGLFGARIGAILIGLMASLLTYRFILDLTQERSIALIATAALNASFIFGALFMMLMPDTLLFALILPILWSVLAIERRNSIGNWLLLGGLLGLAGLSKYTAVLFLMPIALYLLLRRRYDLFYTPKMLPGVALAALLITPVILWNIQHDWISFTYQSSHVVGSQSIHWAGFGRSLAAQFGGYSPLLVPVAFYGLYRALRSPRSELLLAGLFGLVMMLFFTYASLYKTALPHWTAPFYLLFIPIGIAFLLQSTQGWRRYAQIATGVTLLITVVLYSELALKWMPMKPYQSLHRDIYGFKTIMKEANAALAERPNSALAVPHWNLASRAFYYNSPYDSDLFLIDTREDQFDVWEQGSPVGKDLLIISTKAFKLKPKRITCDTLKEAKRFDISFNDTPINEVRFSWCENFQNAPNLAEKTRSKL